MSIGYQFPTIHNLSDVLPHIDDSFRVVVKDDLTFVNYNMMGNDVFPDVIESTNSLGSRSALRAAIRRECRGIVFDTATGDLVSRPFHKFFNAGERESLALDLIDVDAEHCVLEKLDGSMIRPLPTVGGIRWGTKMGITDVALLAETFVADKPEYYELARVCAEEGATPIFEFCSRETQIVIDHPVDRMVLTAIRFNWSGEYMTFVALRNTGTRFGIDVVDRLSVSVGDMTKFVGDVKAETEGEGIVLRFADGHMVKVKNDWYSRIHRAKDQMRTERNVVALILAEEMDDLLPALQDVDKYRMLDFIDSFQTSVRARIGVLSMAYDVARSYFATKKDYALGSVGGDQINRSMIFALWDAKAADAAAAIDRVIRAGLSSETAYGEMKTKLGLNTGWKKKESEE